MKRSEKKKKKQRRDSRFLALGPTAPELGFFFFFPRKNTNLQSLFIQNTKDTQKAKFNRVCHHLPYSATIRQPDLHITSTVGTKHTLKNKLLKK